MHRFWLMAVGAGLASAAVFLFGLTGSTSSIMLAYLSPLPLFAAALAAGGVTGIVAAVLGTVPVMVVAGPQVGLAYAALAAAPAALLGHLAMLSRSDEAGGIEWYPSSALAGWLCTVGLAGLVLLCGLLAGQPAGLSGTAGEMATEFASWLQVEDKKLFVGMLQPILPGITIASWMLLLVVNGVLAQGLLVALNRAARPSPDIGALTLPRWIAIAGALAALAVILFSGDYSYFARNMLIVIAVPYFLQGLSVVHVLARKLGGDNMVLAIFYVTLVVVGWGVAPVIVLLGLIEQIAGLRRLITKEGRT